MSIFGSVKEKLEEEAVDKAVDELGKDGKAGAAGIGQLRYNYETNKLSIEPDPKVLNRVRESWEKHHGL